MSYVGFILITRYRDIDRGIGDLAIIAVPRDQTISRMKASLTHALLNMQGQSLDAAWKALIDGQLATGCHRMTHAVQHTQ